MTALVQYRGILVFGLIAGIFLIAAFAAYQATGPMGIEERFNTAAGLSSDEGEEEAGGIVGFFVEGNALYYLLVIVVLVIACAAIYWRFHE